MREPAYAPCAPRITIAIADDHPVMREGLARIIADECDLAVVSSAATAPELRALIIREPPQVLVMELMLRDGDGLALIKDLVTLAPTLRIVVFSLQPEDVYGARCLRAGAHAYVMKHEAVATLLRAIRVTAGGGIAVSARLSTAVLAGTTTAPAPANGVEAHLTDRELQVFRLAGQAESTRAIADKLGVSVKTIETHRENIKSKLHLQTHAELVARAAQWLRETNR
jgi:DNA-binding NarL/FixJ family response regulator